MTEFSGRKGGPIQVTRPSLPPLEEVMPYLEEIWRTRQLTNSGPLHEQLEAALRDYLGVRHISLFANGTLALVAALRALKVSGEVITTPYSFVATANALLWNDVTPIFVDIDPVTLNLDPVQVEAAITSKTSAILPVHVYGHSADVSGLKDIADRYRLHLIFDAAHCFGVEDEGGSILRHGDMSILSFHATKIFNTFEGGAVVTSDADTKQRVDCIKNFGFANETKLVAAGINAKMNEFQAAIGLAQLPHIGAAKDARARIDALYRERLSAVVGVRCHERSKARAHNYSYFPIFVDSDYDLTRDELYLCLREHGIYSRRYFYPLIPEFSIYQSLVDSSDRGWPNAIQASERVLCLPLYPDLSEQDVIRISEIIKQYQRG
ncbi:DegT/DnrJ/EryC1/StrS family aminotransferase [Marinobacter nauticus]|uniref:dTDP-4-amino-4,6-dideoxygalactose transaminase n=1 Tax=Marinobacter nauticus TaxID=2743 RepID=A0A368UYF2_MARNT|nr:DegT/DnrJ/EryC1/StrS family aminotransferase [Marinobacter nauticus]RBP72686.1 dTDP-4-amino-4,6-dideoxygalactose transaminase [Marinobacter nauticus]RCW33613.1 dTDP-4-amino-4,6-dideoxygalactose transaminase [Marinobacter nauticus]